MKKLREWQEQAYKIFQDNNCLGIVEAATGSGKTVLGIKLIEDSCFEAKKIVVVVPTIQLMYQWHRELQKIFSTTWHNGITIGLVGDGKKQIEDNIIIGVINSLRELRDFKIDILVLDEVHHYLSDENVKFLINNTSKKILGLSATVERQDKRNYDFLGLKVIYTYSVNTAINNKDLCNYKIVGEKVNLSIMEKESYDKHDSIIKQFYPIYRDNAFLSKDFNAVRLRRAISQRRKIINQASEKVTKAFKLIYENNNKKIIVFAETINSIINLSKLLQKNNINCVVYHSKLDRKKREEELNAFANNDCNVLLSVKALDEGLNVPEANMAIIMAGTSSQRQFKQRLGRVLRKKDETVNVYVLYVNDSVDQKNFHGILKESLI